MKLGDRVRIVEGEVVGRLFERREHLDGSVRWLVNYWHDGHSRDVACMEFELELIS